MRRAPTVHDRVLERARISGNDMLQAAAFAEAAIALDKARVTTTELADARMALEVAAIIYYARPFTNNELTGRRKPPKRPTAGEPPLSKIDLGPLKDILIEKEARRLHRSVLRLRNKIVAHAESRYFPVRLVKKAFLPKESGRLGDFAVMSLNTVPKLDLFRVSANAKQLAAAFSAHTHFAAHEVRRTRKRLRAR